MDNLGPDNTDDAFIDNVARHLGANSPAKKDLDALVEHVAGVMGHWCRIVGMEAGQDMRDFPNVLRELVKKAGGA